MYLFKIIIFILVIIYLIYHTLTGSRGLKATLDVDHMIALHQTKLDKLQRERASLEAKLSLLKDGNFDLDYLDEIARRELGVAQIDEKVVIIASDLKVEDNFCNQQP